MATSFSANQYENAFISKKLQNWECPSTYPENPRPMSGSTKIIANDRGHLQDGVKRSSKNPWGNFVGTWDLPRHIPGNCAKVNTARTTYAQQRLKMASEEANEVLNGTMKNSSRRVMREGTNTNLYDKPRNDVRLTSRPQSGAAAPITQACYGDDYLYKPPTPIGQYTYMKRTPTPQKLRTPTPDKYVFETARSPIPAVPDIPEVLAQEAVRARETTPQGRQSNDGLYAL